MAKVKFYRGSTAAYLSSANVTTDALGVKTINSGVAVSPTTYDSAKYLDGIYFDTDKKLLYMNGKIYGFNSEDNHLIEDIIYSEQVTAAVIEDGVEVSAPSHDPILTVSYTDGTADEVIHLNDVVKYMCAMPAALTTPAKVGGVNSGIRADVLRAKSVSQILDMILFPELQPTIQNPSASLSLKTGFANNGVYEIGANAPQEGTLTYTGTLINGTNFTASLNKGSVTVAGRPNQSRSGDIVANSADIYYKIDNLIGTLPTDSSDTYTVSNIAANKVSTSNLGDGNALKINAGAYTYTCEFLYAAGPEAKTSYGNPITNPAAIYPSGTMKPTCVIYGTYPIFANGQTCNASSQDTALPTTFVAETALNKLPLTKLIKTAATIGIKFASEADLNTRWIVKYPAFKSITKIEFFNTVSKAWEVFPTANYNVNVANNNKWYVYGNTCPNSTQSAGAMRYKTLTTTQALSGALQIRITFNNN